MAQAVRFRRHSHQAVRGRPWGFKSVFHLTGPAFEPTIEPTVSALRDLSPQIVVPAQCTGWRAQHRLGVELPDAFVPNAVGTSVTLSAA